MRRLELLVCVAATLGWGCRGTVVDHVPLDIALPGAPECHASIGPITLTALGDFPTSDRVVAQIDGRGAPIDPITRFPSSVLAFAVSAHAPSAGWDAFGWAMRASVTDDPALVMRPLGLSCPLADPEARLPIGAGIAVLDEARVMFVGGLDERGEAMRRVAILHVREERVELPRVDHVIPIAFAAATLVPEGDAVLVAGGAARQGGDPAQTWERIPLNGGAATFGSLVVPRRDHGAIAVDVGRVHGVLLVGGSDGSRALRSIEWVDPTSDGGDVMRASLAFPRVSPLLVQLDASHIAVVGGLDEPGGRPVASIEVLDVAHDSIRTLSVALGAPDWIAALPSGRVAWATTTTLSIVSPREERIDTAAVAPSVLDPVAVGLGSGRVLLEGHRADGGRLGYLIDPGAGTVTALATSRVPRDMVALFDGATLELAATGASVRRDERLTPFDSPPPSYLFAADRAALALDASARWTTSGGVLEVHAGFDDARLDVPVLRLRDFEALLDGVGSYDVVLTGEHLETLATISVTDAAVSLGACTVSRAADARVRIARTSEGSLVIGSEAGATVACHALDHALRVGIGIVAHQGASLRSLALTRDL